MTEPTSLHVGFLRAVMQGREGLSGDVLRTLLAEAGGVDGRTFRSTGNVVFTATDGAGVCGRLAALVADVVGRETPVLHRSAEELCDLVDADPFAGAPVDAAEQIVVLTDASLDETAVRAVLPSGTGLLAVHGGHDACCWRADRHGPHPMPAIEDLTDAAVTARSIGTVEGLAALVRRMQPAGDPSGGRSGRGSARR